MSTTKFQSCFLKLSLGHHFKIMKVPKHSVISTNHKSLSIDSQFTCIKNSQVLILYSYEADRTVYSTLF